MHLIFSKNSSSRRRQCGRNRELLTVITLLLVVASLTFTTPLQATSQAKSLHEALSRIDAQLQQGNWQKSRESLLKFPDSARDQYWNLLWALSDQDGMTSYRALLKLVAEDPPAPISCRAVEGLAEFHLMRHDYALALAQIDQHLQSCTAAGSHGLLLKLRGQAYLRVNLPEEAASSFKQALAADVSPRSNAETILALGEAHAEKRDYARADHAYMRLTQSLTGDYNALAIRNLRDIRKQIGDSTGVATLDKLLGKVQRGDEAPGNSGNVPDEGRAMSTQSAFAIRIGQFTNQEDAESLLHKFRADGYTVAVNETSIAGNTLYAVDLGRFDTAVSAARFMHKLQKQTNATYRVVSY